MLILFLNSPIHRIMRKGFFLKLHTTSRSSNSPYNNNGNNGHNILESYMIAIYKQPTDIRRNNGYRAFQLIDFCQYLILPFQYTSGISFNSHTILIVIANVPIKIFKKFGLLLE